MIDPPSRRQLHQIIASDSPTRDDFLSYQELGKELPEDAKPDVVDRWQGISLYDSEERARAVAERFGLGTYIATLDLPDDGRFRIERTGRRPGHYTVWGDADALCTFVVTITPV
jgi:hypothetical protein